MNNAEQVGNALRLGVALHAQGLELVAHHQEGGSGSYVEADYVLVVGWLARGGYWLRGAAPPVTSTGPASLRLLP